MEMSCVSRRCPIYPSRWVYPWRKIDTGYSGHMWKDLKTWLTGAWERAEAHGHGESDPRLAAAALLVEVMHSDFQSQPHERDVIRSLLIRHLGMEESEADALLETAENESRHHVSLYPAVSLINDKMSREEKVDLVGWLWNVAYADGRVDKYEDAVIRKIAELLYVDHADFIRMKHVAARQAT